LAPRVQTIVQDCALAARAADARDKYFTVVVREFDPVLSVALRSELPALEAAKLALSSSLSRVAAATPALQRCSAEPALLLERTDLVAQHRQKGFQGLRAQRRANCMSNADLLQASVSTRRASGRRGGGGPSKAALPNAKIERLVESANEVDNHGISLLLASARSAILGVRTVLR